MKEPYDGKVNMRLVVKRFKDKVFYYVHTHGDSSKYSLRPCMLSESSVQGFPSVRFFNEKMKLDTSYSQGVDWKRLFDIYEEAEAEARRLNSLYFDGFRYKPFVSIKELEEHKNEMICVEKLIDKLLSGFENYNGIDFCNVNAGGTQIRLHHKEIKGYTYGDQITIKPDYSNIDEVAIQVANVWIQNDTPSKIAKEKSFIAAGEKYGWD